MLQKPQARDFIKKVLGAVVDPKQHGTAGRSLGRWLPTRNPLVNWHIAKTGTTSSREETFVQRPGTLNAMITGAISIRGCTYTYIAQVGPRGGEVDIGPWVYGGHMGALVDTALLSVAHRIKCNDRRPE